MLESILGKMGLAAAQIRQIDLDVQRGFVKLFLQAISSGDANGYLKARLGWIDERQEQEDRAAANPPPPPPPPRPPTPFDRGRRRW